MPPIPTGHLIARVRFRDPSSLPPEVENGLSPGVRAMHRDALRLMQETLREQPAWQAAPVDAFVTQLYRVRAEQLGWAPQSTFRQLCNACGALSHLALYTDAPHPIKLSSAPFWKAAVRHWELLAQVNQPVNQAATTLPDLERALELEQFLPTRIALMLMWLTAARVGCVLQLRRGDLDLALDGQLNVQFSKGKGVLFRGIYSVPTAVPERWLQEIRSYLDATADPAALLFPETPELPLHRRMAALLEAIRRANPDLSMRAMRRGSLQKMALAGTSVETLMTFSGHTNPTTLKRYLDWGRLLGTAIHAGTAAAALLTAGSH